MDTREQNYQLLALREAGKELAKPGQNVYERILVVIIFIMATSGSISEFNLLTLFKFANIDVNNHKQMEVVRKALSFYAGAGAFEIIDNGLGLKEVIVDEESIHFQKGRISSIAKLEIVINVLRMNLEASLNGE